MQRGDGRAPTAQYPGNPRAAMGATMEYRQLGRTGLEVSVMALGCGGPSRLGLSTGRTTEQSAAVVRAALDAGVNIIDTATAYRSEALVAAGLRGRKRDQVVLSSKRGLAADNGDRLLTGAELEAAVEASLRRLRTDYIDIYHLHGVGADQYAHARQELVPTLQRLKEAGKVRFLGITERFGSDTEHLMLRRALHDGLFDVIMVGFSMLNQTARDTVLRVAGERAIGTMIMFAVRRAFSRPRRLRELLAELADRGEVDQELATAADPFSFLAADTEDLADAAYRYCLDQPGVSTVLSGTGNVDHLRDNVASFARGPLPAAARARIDRLFARVTSVSGS